MKLVDLLKFFKLTIMYKNFDVKNVNLIGLFDIGYGLKNYNPIIPLNKNEKEVIEKVNIFNKDL
jgi:hypothetical protein